MPDINMSDDEAKKEVESIQAEIAAEKGIKPPEKEEEKESDPKPEDKEDPKAEEKQDEGEEIEPQERHVSDNKIPLSKHQDIKKKLETERDEALAREESSKKQIETLAEQLRLAKTSKSMDEKVKAFSEETGMDEQAARKLVQIAIDEAKPTVSQEDIQRNQKVEIFIKKQEAEEKFQSELSEFISEEPEAAGFADKIRAQAFKPENLNKSLYEIFNRFVKTESAPAKKKTGEVSRGVARTNNTGFDVTKVLEKVGAGTANPFSGLTEAQIDEVFTAMEKTGSRYHK